MFLIPMSVSVSVSEIRAATQFGTPSTISASAVGLYNAWTGRFLGTHAAYPGSPLTRYWTT